MWFVVVLGVVCGGLGWFAVNAVFRWTGFQGGTSDFVLFVASFGFKAFVLCSPSMCLELLIALVPGHCKHFTFLFIQFNPYLH